MDCHVCDVVFGVDVVLCSIRMTSLLETRALWFEKTLLAAATALPAREENYICHFAFRQQFTLSSAQIRSYSQVICQKE